MDIRITLELTAQSRGGRNTIHVPYTSYLAKIQQCNRLLKTDTEHTPMLPDLH